MSKEIAQTVGSKRIAWLLAILAAFAVMATVGSRHQGASAGAVNAPSPTMTAAPVSGSAVLPGQPVTFVVTVASADTALNANDFVVTVNLGSGYTATGTAVTSGSAIGAADTNTATRCASDSITTAGTYICTVTATVNASGTLSSTATVTAYTGESTGAVAGTGNSAAVTHSLVTVTNGTGLVGSTIAVVFPLPIGVTYCSDTSAAGTNPRQHVAGDAGGTAANIVHTWSTADNNTANAHSATATGSGTVTISLKNVGGNTTTDCFTATATVTAIAPVLSHIADDNATAMPARDVHNNVRGSRHTICATDSSGVGVVLPGAVTYPGAITVTNGGGYLNAADDEPTVTDVTYPQLTIGGSLATCFSWRSLGAGDQTITMTYIGAADLLPHTVNWDNSTAEGATKEWNRLEDSEVTLSGAVSGTGAGNSTTDPVISKAVSLYLNQATGLYQSSSVRIQDAFWGGHTNTGSSYERWDLAGVNWTVDRAAGSSTCGYTTQSASPYTLLPLPTAGTTTLLPNGTVGGKPDFRFWTQGCAPGQVVTFVITGQEPGAFSSGEGVKVTQLVEFKFTAQVAAKQVFLAWAGQRIILEHDWRIPGGDMAWAWVGGENGPVHVNDAATVLAQAGSLATNDYCPFDSSFAVTYVKGSGPGNFLPGLGASVANLADTATVVVADDDSQSFITDDDIVGDANGSCISRVLYESEDQGQVDIEAFVTNAEFQSEPGFDGLAYTKHAFVIYYMKINTVNVSLATQFSKPSHNSSFVGYRDWADTADVTKAPTNPWDASKDDADNAADWNVSKDLLVRGRVTGWFTTTNPSGRARDDSNPLNVLPADRWVMPNDWALLAGGPADKADGSAAIGTAEQFRPYFDIMVSPNSVYSLNSPDGAGWGFAGYVYGDVVTDVSLGNTGLGTAGSPIQVDSCTYLVTGLKIVFSDAKTTTHTVASCSSGDLVLTVARSAAPAGGIDVVANLDRTGSTLFPLMLNTTYGCAYLQTGDPVRIGLTLSGIVVSCTSNLLIVSVPVSSAAAAPAGTMLIAPSTVPFEGPYSLIDIPGLAPAYGGAALSDLVPGNIRDTIYQDGDVNMWDAPMPPAMVSMAIRGTGTIKRVYKDEVYYRGTPNTAALNDGGTQTYPNPFYVVNIPDSMWIPAVSVGGGYLWDTWSYDGPGGLGDRSYWFWKPVRIGVNSALIGDSTLSATDNAELAIIRMEQDDTSIARDLVIYSDNHGEFMVAANGDFKTDLTACQTNVLAGGKHCKTGDKVGTGTITATVDYPDFRGKHFPVLSNTATVTWLWGGYKDVTVEDGETDQYKYIVFHAMDRDGFCSTLGTGAILLHSVLTYEDDYDDFSSLGARYNGDPDENVDFMIDSGEGIIIDQSGGGAINDGKQFATGVETFSVTENDPATSGVKEFPLSSLAASGQTDECQAWVKVSNSLLGVVNVLTIAHDDEGNIGFDRVIDLTNTMSYTLSFRWSLITWAGADAIPVSDALKGTGASGQNPGGNDISASVTAIYGWNAAAQQWLGYFPSGVNVPGANDLTSLKTGDAYWIAITGPSSVTWTIATNVN